MAALQGAAFVAEAFYEDIGITCRVAADHVAALAPLLVAAKIDLLEMTSRRRRLEDTHLARYGGEETRLQ